MAWKLLRINGLQLHGCWEPPVTSAAPDKKTFRFLLAVLALTFFQCGFLGYMFFIRIVARGIFPEYLHLGLAVLFPFLGHLVGLRGVKGLVGMTAVSILVLLLIPLLYILVPLPSIANIVFFLGAFFNQLLICAGTLFVGRLSIQSRLPGLTVSSVWLVSVLAFPGATLASASIFDNPLYRGVMAVVLSVAYVNSILKKTGTSTRLSLVTKAKSWHPATQQ